MEKKSIHSVHSHAFLVIPNDGQLQIYQTRKQRKTIVDCLDRPQSTTRLITVVRLLLRPRWLLQCFVKKCYYTHNLTFWRICLLDYNCADFLSLRHFVSTSGGRYFSLLMGRLKLCSQNQYCKIHNIHRLQTQLTFP